MRHGNATRFENDVEEGHSDGVRPNQYLLSAAVILWSPLLLSVIQQTHKNAQTDLAKNSVSLFIY